jgi:hypothetical protein
VSSIVDAVHEPLVVAGVSAPVSLEVVGIVRADPRRGLFWPTEVVEAGLSQLDFRVVKLDLGETEDPAKDAPLDEGCTRLAERRAEPLAAARD